MPYTQSLIAFVAQAAERNHEDIPSLEDLLPSGSGIDAGTKVDIARSKPNRIVLTFGYHHMDENGYYDGWTEHKAIITPCFDGWGIDVRITGRNRNGILDYLHDVFYWSLAQKTELILENDVRKFRLVRDEK